MEPMQFVNGWRLLNIVALIHLWVIGDSATSSFTLILFLLIMACLRWRMALPAWTVLLDALVCCLYFAYTDIGYYALAQPVFELALLGKWPFALLFFASLAFSSIPSSLLFWYFLQALFFGTFAFVTIKNQQGYKLEAYEERMARYELERIKVELLEANQWVAQQAERTERYRIARELHDHIGHDLTGASLALQAYEYVQEPEEAEKLLQEVKSRIERSTISLRETVHNMTPTALIGVESLEYIVQNYHQVDIQFRKSGDMSYVPAHKWGLLEACLKEALTNVARHSDATKVDVDLQVTESIVRLFIGDNGTNKNNSPSGSGGLRHLKLRARSLGGSLSTSQENGFLLVCVIPLEQKGGNE